jgi:hypothetical protein
VAWLDDRPRRIRRRYGRQASDRVENRTTRSAFALRLAENGLSRQPERIDENDTHDAGPLPS